MKKITELQNNDKPREKLARKGVEALNSKELIKKEQEIQNRIFTIRCLQVMIDSDLAQLYQVETKILNQAVKRNIERFPERFRFQLSQSEKLELVISAERITQLILKKDCLIVNIIGIGSSLSLLVKSR